MIPALFDGFAIAKEFRWVISPHLKTWKIGYKKSNKLS